MGAHEHEWHGLWWHWGRFGNQDEHVHSCLTDRCQNTVLVGAGVNCAPSDGTHHQLRWDSRRMRWAPADPVASSVGSSGDTKREAK